MIDLERMISDILDCLGWPYVSPGGTGKDCSKCGIDCSGLLVRAYKLQGESLYHGSNYIARYELTGEPEKLRSEGQLERGMAVFKWSKTGEPERYSKDGKGNFHHIGVVTGVHPLVITHASSVAGKVKQDCVVGKWTHCGYLKRVRYDTKQQEETGMTGRYKVVAQSGSTVNLRKDTSTTSEILARVPIGAEVDGTQLTTEGWMRVTWDGASGFMMEKFLQAVETDGAADDRLAAIEAELAAVKEDLALIRGRVESLEGGVG